MLATRVCASTFLSEVLLTVNRVVDAAKKMRIKTHPDRLKKPDMSEEKQKIDAEASNIGQAADVLLDPEQVSFFFPFVNVKHY